MKQVTRAALFDHIKQKESYLSIGLDTDIRRIPKFLLDYEDPVFEFNKAIIEATHDLCVAYKPNLAFYEHQGAKGLLSLEKTMRVIPKSHFTIADAKRGDIGNTSAMYAEAFFNTMGFDSITVAPYMGADSVTPFLQFEGKWVILLALTSNTSSADFQQTTQEAGQPLYEKVMRTAQNWGTKEELMYVVGATHPETFQHIREIAPDHFLLVPGVGAQGGDLAAISKFGFNKECGMLVNSSRGIIYAGDGKDFAEKARTKALELQQQMSELLKTHKII